LRLQEAILDHVEVTVDRGYAAFARLAFIALMRFDSSTAEEVWSLIPFRFDDSAIP
jgi:hypothetical protein